MRDLVEIFIEHGKKKNYQAITLNDHRNFLKVFFDFIDVHYPDVKEITGITREMIRAYEKLLTVRIDRRGKLMRIERRHRYLSALKNFFEFLEREEKIYKNPAAIVALPRLKVRLVRNILTEEDMENILKSCSKNSMKDIRDRAMLEVLYSTGLRSDELCNININDLDMEERTLFVRKPKLGRERIVPFGASALYWVKTYLEKVRPLIDTGDDFLFVTLSGKKFSNDVLCSLVKQRVRRAGVDKEDITTHTFRHTCASHMVKHGADIRYVQKHLGHKHISTTERYLQIEISDLKSVHARTHPRELEDW